MLVTSTRCYITKTLLKRYSMSLDGNIIESASLYKGLRFFCFFKSRSVRIRRRVSEVKFMGSEFSSILVGKSAWFGRVQSSVCPDLDLDSVYFWRYKTWIDYEWCCFFPAQTLIRGKRDSDWIFGSYWSFDMFRPLLLSEWLLAPAAPPCSLSVSMYHKDIKKKNPK